LANEQQDELPDLLRRLLNMPEFRTKAARMGKVARVGKTQIEYWLWGDEKLEKLAWQQK
jgi:hypothetical protein